MFKQVESRVADRIIVTLSTIDPILHRFRWSPAWICLVAEIGNGWDPGCEDWSSRAKGFHKWLYEHMSKPQAKTA